MADTALVDAHLEGERRLREALKQHLREVWAGLPGHDRENIDQWLSEVLPAVLAAEQQSSTLTNTYLARALDRSELFPVKPEDVTGAAIRNGTPPEAVYERPFVTLWSELGEGTDWTEASAAALQRAQTMGATDVQLSMRDTLGAVQTLEPRIVGWERVSNPGACDFCQQVNGAFVYGGVEPMPLHANCGCSSVPVLGEPRERTRTPEGIAIHDHGEYGPVLTAADDHFLTRSAALAR